MATVPQFDNKITFTGEPGILTVNSDSFNFTEIHFVENPFPEQIINTNIDYSSPDSSPDPSPDPELPDSICPLCASVGMSLNNGYACCGECGCQIAHSVTVTVDELADIQNQLQSVANDPTFTIMSGHDFSNFEDLNITNPCGEIKIVPIKRYDDIVGDIRNRFEILDL